MGIELIYGVTEARWNVFTFVYSIIVVVPPPFIIIIIIPIAFLSSQMFVLKTLKIYHYCVCMYITSLHGL